MLRNLDRKAEDEQREIERREKALADYTGQLGKPFEHEARLKELLPKQAQLNASLDLDKHEAQVIDDVPEPEQKAVPATFAARIRRDDAVTAVAP